jgi:hypothetical protein
MNSRHVYIGNYYSFPTPSSKYRVSAVWGFFDVFYEIFLKYREGNHYRVTATSALSRLCSWGSLHLDGLWQKLCCS